MLNVTTFPFATTAAETVVSLARRNVEIFDQVAETAKATPMAPFFAMASKVNHSALEGFEAMTGVLGADAAKPKAKAKQAAKTANNAAKTVKKAVDAQADLMAEAGSQTVAAAGEMEKAVEKAAKSAQKGDAVTLFDDLTAINGIGPATMRKLQDAGIRSIGDVAEASAKTLDEIVEESGIRMVRFSAKDWIADAKRLIKTAA